MIAVMFEWWLLVVWYLLWIVLLSMVIIHLAKRQWRIRAARQRGLYPPVDQEPTLDDVRRLARAGEVGLALYLYGEMNDVGEKEARAAVVQLLQSEPPPSTGLDATSQLSC
jgi:hypothetical protein